MIPAQVVKKFQLFKVAVTFLWFSFQILHNLEKDIMIQMIKSFCALFEEYFASIVHNNRHCTTHLYQVYFLHLDTLFYR